jgi:tetratricopeptide (TPR) repeat protein
MRGHERETAMRRANWRRWAIAAMALAAASQASAQSLPGAYLAGRQAAVQGDVRAAAESFEAALRLDPQNPRLMELAVVNLLASGEIGRAAPIAARLLQAAPDHRMGHLALALESIDEGRYDGALARLEARAEALRPIIGRLLEAWAAAGAGDAEAREVALAALGERDIFGLYRDYHRGLILATRGEHEAAAESYAAALEALQNPTTRFALAYGATLEALGRADEARALYERTLAAAFGDAAISAALARLDAGRRRRCWSPTRGRARRRRCSAWPACSRMRTGANWR